MNKYLGHSVQQKFADYDILLANADIRCVLKLIFYTLNRFLDLKNLI